MPALPVPSLVPSFTVEVLLGPLEDHGTTHAGHRRVVPIAGGTVSGEISGQIVPGGADWQVVRPDGTVEVDARYTVREDDGSLVLLHARGLRSGPPAVLEALLAGEAVDPSEYTFRTAITVETAVPALAWAQRSLFIAAAVRTSDTVAYAAYRVE